jgi:hypothetical protein
MIMLTLTGATTSIFRSARGVSVMHANSAFIYERTTPPLRDASLARRVRLKSKDISAQHTPLRAYSYYLCPSQKALRDISCCVKSLKAKSQRHLSSFGHKGLLKDLKAKAPRCARLQKQKIKTLKSKAPQCLRLDKFKVKSPFG